MKRDAKIVVEHILLPSASGMELYYLCPGCNIPLPREQMRFCDYCGQHLCWVIHLRCHRKNTHSMHQSQEIPLMSY